MSCVSDTLRIKVCGITLPEQARAIVNRGAWGIGVVFARASSRVVDVEAAAQVCAAVSPDVARVGVFVEGAVADIADAARRCGLTHIQIHRKLDVAALREASGCLVIQAFAVDGPAALDDARASMADLVLLDASVKGMDGGTGTRFDWDLLAAEPLGRPFVLAGGLDPENVAEAVHRVAPDYLDVSSGVESAPGVKDLDRVTLFVERARDAARADVA